MKIAELGTRSTTEYIGIFGVLLYFNEDLPKRHLFSDLLNEEFSEYSCRFLIGRLNSESLRLNATHFPSPFNDLIPKEVGSLTI